MTDRLSSPMLRLILGAAGLVVIMWGIKTAAHVLLLLLLSLFLAFVMLPLPRWLMRRYRLNTQMAVGLTLVLVCVAYLAISLLLLVTTVRTQEKLPLYQANFWAMDHRVDSFLSAHGLRLEDLSPIKPPIADRVIDFARGSIPTVAGLLSDRLLIWLLSLLFLVEIVEPDRSKRGPLAAGLEYYGSDVQGFIGVMAKTGAIIALADLVLFLALRVDFPVLWCVLAFFVSFIPGIGIAISLVPPVIVALLKSGWTTALLVALGIILINAVVGYVIQPKFMKKGLNISFLGITLSLIGWSFLLGPWGAVLAVPLTLSLRKFMAKHSKDETAMGAGFI